MSRDKCITEVLSYSMSFMSFSPSLFFSPPLCWGLLGLHTAHSQSAHQVSYTHTHTHTYTNTHTHIFMHFAIPQTLAAQRVVFACLSAPPPKHTQSSSGITLSAAGWGWRVLISTPPAPPPAEPTHRRATNPGGRQPHSANSDRNWFDSFLSLHLWILVLKYLTETGLSSSWTDLISLSLIFPLSF